jgi:hypothetical protein
MDGRLLLTENLPTAPEWLFHYQKAYVYITETCANGRYGFDEWHSNSYLPITCAAGQRI